MQAANNIDLNSLVLPTEVKGLEKKSGSLYFSKSVKNEVLIPTNFWGEVKSAGLHFVPKGTSLINGLSLAGGATGDANLNEVKITRKSGKELKTIEFDLSSGGDFNSHNFQLQPGDVVYLRKERFYENRIWYTSILSILATTLGSYLIYKKID
ncbi:SLBB domain protein [Halobacteriovorax sp. BALOs_7]|nr:SLBB domain protein [Halobacteriovorax sp. BALOs_7]